MAGVDRLELGGAALLVDRGLEQVLVEVHGRAFRVVGVLHTMRRRAEPPLIRP